MKGSTNQLGGIPCPGCPIYPHIPDGQFRFPSCELCHWPAIGVGSTHVWPCAFCSRATRIACPCDQPAPCLHGQALYAHVVTLAANAPCTLALSGSAR